MARKTEQFINELAATPTGELTGIKVPKKLQKETGRRVREIMINSGPEQTKEKSPVEKQTANLLNEIQQLEEQQAVVGEEIFKQVVLPTIQEKKSQAQVLSEQIQIEQPTRQRDGGRGKREKIKSALREVAERADKESEKILGVLNYLPEEGLAGAADFALEAMGGNDKVQEKFVSAYLAKDNVPSMIRELLEIAEQKIKTDKKSKVAKVADPAIRERLLQAVETTPITSDEIKKEFALANMKGKKELSVAIVTQAINEGVVGNEEIQTVATISMTGVRKKAREDLIKWSLKDQPRMMTLQHQAESGWGQDGKKSTITPDGKKELAELQQRERNIKDGRVDRDRTSQQVLEEAWSNRNNLRTLEEVAPKLSQVETAVQEATQDWQAKLETDFEKTFSEDLKATQKTAEELSGEYHEEVEKLTQLNGEVERIFLEHNDGVDLGSSKTKESVRRLGQLKKEIEEQNNKLVEIGQKLDRVSKRFNTNTAVEKVLAQRRQNLENLKGQLDRITIPKGKMFEGISSRRDELTKTVVAQKDPKNVDGRYQTVSDEYVSGYAFSDKVKKYDKQRTADEAAEPVRKIVQEIPQQIGASTYSRSRNAATDRLGNLHYMIGENIDRQLKAEEGTNLSALRQAESDLEKVRAERKKLEAKSLVIGKAGKLKEFDNKIAQQEEVIKKLKTKKAKIERQQIVVADLRRTMEKQQD